MSDKIKELKEINNKLLVLYNSMTSRGMINRDIRKEEYYSIQDEVKLIHEQLNSKLTELPTTTEAKRTTKGSGRKTKD